MAAVKWSNAKVNALKDAGRYGIGDGLSMRVHVRQDGNVTKRWLFKIARQGRTQEVALGRWPEMRLDDARAAALEARALAVAGAMPKQMRAKAIAEREAALAQELATSLETEAAQAVAATMPTISDMIGRTFEWRSPDLKGGGAAGRWMSPLRTLVIPKIGHLPITAISDDLIVQTLADVWHTKPAAAEKAAQRLGQVVTFARLEKFDVPPDAAKLAMLRLGTQRHDVEHIPAPNWQDLPDLYARFADAKGIGSLALRWLMLTACRTGEMRFARPEHLIEIDGGAVWRVPAENLKTSRTRSKVEQRDLERPLGPVEVALWHEIVERGRGSEWVFCGARGKKPVSDSTASKLVREQGYAWRPHGLRSSFRTWAADTGRDELLAEIQLGHVAGNAVTRTYRRTGALERRRALMADWIGHVVG